MAHLDLGKRVTNHPLPFSWARRCALRRVSSLHAGIASHALLLRVLSVSWRHRVLLVQCDPPPAHYLQSEQVFVLLSSPPSSRECLEERGKVVADLGLQRICQWYIVKTVSHIDSACRVLKQSWRRMCFQGPICLTLPKTHRQVDPL